MFGRYEGFLRRSFRSCFLSQRAAESSSISPQAALLRSHHDSRSANLYRETLAPSARPGGKRVNFIARPPRGRQLLGGTHDSKKYGRLWEERVSHLRSTPWNWVIYTVRSGPPLISRASQAKPLLRTIVEIATSTDSNVDEKLTEAPSDDFGAWRRRAAARPRGR